MPASIPEQLKEEGLRLFQQRKYDQALKTFETAAAAFAAQDNLLGQAEMLNNVGVVHRLQRRPEEALQALQEAADLFAQWEDPLRQAQTLANIADVHAGMRQTTEAARYYSDAAALFAHYGDGKRQSQVLRALSLLRLRQGQWLAAMTEMEASLSAAPRLGPFRWLFRLLLRFALSLFGQQ